MNGVCNIDKIKEIMIRDYSENPNCIFLVECIQRKKDGIDNDNIYVYRNISKICLYIAYFSILDIRNWTREDYLL